MIDAYYWPTPNGQKIMMFLEESGLAYRIIPVDLMAGDQHAQEFLSISPSGKMPAIVDDEPAGTGCSIAIFESGAILLYLAEKTGLFIPIDVAGRSAVVQWLFWQVGGLGPASGLFHNFNTSVQDGQVHARDYFHQEVTRLYGVLDHRLEVSRFIAVDTYTIADMAIFPWVTVWKKQKQELSGFPNLLRWEVEVRQRPATARTYLHASEWPKRRAHSSTKP
ncbi:glutathione S-transferase N-terminal domain-containing protein [Paraburkholderia sediminicola]|uniref:glutathione S-transferase N-terminal domain-containing protein n=1 Tax=Paraburkholderia sediminicola TaxID=458836 RepID=UPI0038BD0ABB